MLRVIEIFSLRETNKKTAGKYYIEEVFKSDLRLRNISFYNIRGKKAE